MIPRRIVVATDGSPAAGQAEVFAADEAALMATSGPVEIVVLTAMHDVGHLAEAGGTIPPSREALEAKQVSEAGRAHILGLLARSAALATPPRSSPPAFALLYVPLSSA